MPSLAPRLDTLESTPSFSGQASFAAGSAAAPSLRFTVDPTTGLYRIGASNIGFACAGVAAGGINASAWTLGSASTVGVGGYTHSIQAAPTSSTVLFLRNMTSASTIAQIQVFYNNTTSAGFWRADNVNSFFVTNAAGTLQNFAVADTGACTLGNTSATGPSGGHHSVRTGYSGVSTSMYANGEIHFGNSDSGGTIPTIAGTTTTANNVGLYLSAAANDSNTASDMAFDVRESDVANGSDFTAGTLTSKAFAWSRYGNQLAYLTRGGAFAVYGWSTARNGAGANDGDIRLGNGTTSGLRIQQYDAGNTISYFDNRYDSAVSKMEFRFRTLVASVETVGVTALTMLGSTAMQIGANLGSPQPTIPFKPLIIQTPVSASAIGFTKFHKISEGTSAVDLVTITSASWDSGHCLVIYVEAFNGSTGLYSIVKGIAKSNGSSASNSIPLAATDISNDGLGLGSFAWSAGTGVATLRYTPPTNTDNTVYEITINNRKFPFTLP